MDNFFTEFKKNKSLKENDFDLIKKAYDFAEEAHSGQKRASGEPYFIHCLETALILNSLKLDAKTIAAGILHDVVDDCGILPVKIEKEFGKEIRFFVESVSKLGNIKYRGFEGKVENLRRMLLATAKDIRVIIIKLADRLHNMRTLEFLSEVKQKRISKETLEIYAPIASRLGIGKIKGELEDLAFPYLYPEEYKWLISMMPSRYEERLNYLKKVKPVIEREFKKERINYFEIDYRAKHYYSLYKKLEKFNMNFDEIYDLTALRIIVNDVSDCYRILGILHKFWKPLPGKIKDFIALPKPNGYQSIHTTVFCLDGQIVEFQIRTKKMHEEAEWGIAAHWAYSELDKPEKGVKLDSGKFSWVKQLGQWQVGISQSKEFLDSLRIDFFKNQIFVFTPKGEVIDLPEGSTPVDFAYKIHSDIGDKCAAAKVNNKIAKLNSKLKHGDRVEIMTQKNKKPSPSWLEFVKTSQARSRIKHALGIK